MKKINCILLMLATSFSANADFLQGQVIKAAVLNSTIAKPTILGGTLTRFSAPVLIGSGATGSATAADATSQLHYLQGANGSANRSVTSKLQDNVSVLDFAGVDPTGVADSTTGEQAAINAVCAAGGGTLVFPAGTFKTSSLSLTCSNIQIRGAGLAATTINATTTSANVFAFSGVSNQGIRDLSITYKVTPTAGAAISVVGLRNFTADRLRITGAYKGIYIGGGVIQYFTNLEIINTVATTGVGIYFTGFGNDQFLKNIVLDNPAGAQPLAGIRVNNTNAIWMDSVDAIHAGTGLLIDPQGASDYISWLFVSNSAFDTGTGDGISLSPANASALIKGVTFTGTWTATNTLMGVRISGVGIVDGVRFVGHRSFNNGQSGFFVNGTAGGGTRINLSFTGCDVSGNSITPSSTYSGFDIGAGISGFSITNSRSGQMANFANTQARGIIVNSGTSNNYIISGNDLRGNLTNSLLEGGTGTNKTIANNIGDTEILSSVSGINVNSARGSAGSLVVTDKTESGSNLKLIGNGATTPSKSIRVNGGTLQVVNDAYSAVLMQITDAGRFSVNSGIDDGTNALQVTGNAAIKSVGSGFRVAEGANAKQLLSAAMVSGRVTIFNNSVTATSRIICTRQAGGTNPGAAFISALVAGTSFTVTSTNSADTGQVACEIFEQG